MFVYTREAHPGELVGPHLDFAEKLANAARLRDEVGIKRRLLVDDLEGSAHHGYGLLPNMTWVIGRGGRVVYKSDWTSAANVDAFLDRYEAGKARRSTSGMVGPYLTEQVEFRDLDRPLFYSLLERNGPRARSEFHRAEEIWRQRAGS
ncbi:hypothetical protein BH18ACT5_BH18ACT5_09520 [soil metagenome]